MADFTRTSRIVGIDELDRPLLDAIRSTLAREELDIVLLDVVSVCTTESVPTKRRWIIGPRGKPHTTAAVLTPTWLVWATDASGSPVVSMCRLTDAEVRKFAAAGSTDTGLEVTGFMTPSASQRSTAFIALDGARAGSQFVQQVLDAARDARA